MLKKMFPLGFPEITVRNKVLSANIHPVTLFLTVSSREN
jgi:hypothetical protein